MRLTVLIAITVMALCAPVAVDAQERTFWFHERSIERPDSARDVGPLAVDTAFGDRHSLYNGSVEFTHVDISIPGNNALPVELRRKLPIADRSENVANGALRTSGFGQFADWDLDIPHLSGTFLRAVGWQVTGSAPNNRCSNLYQPRSNMAGALGAPHSFWNGYQLNIPGIGTEPLLGTSQTELPRPTDGANYRWVTKSMAWVSCKPSTRNGYPGEAFLVTTPDGTKYHLDHVIEKWAPHVTAVDTAGTHTAERRNIFFVASKVEDRFGNWVEYTWNGDRLQSITSNDGRSISITYDSVGRISRGSTSGHQWQYIYGNHLLSRVVLPDNTEWNFSRVGHPLVEIHFEYEDSFEAKCHSNVEGKQSNFGSYSVRHPSGALADFTFSPLRHHRSNTPFACMKWVTYYDYAEIPNYSDTHSLIRKQVTGPGLQQAEWTYEYTWGAEGWRHHCETAFPGLCPTQKTQRVNLPNGERIEYDYGVMYGENEGQLLATRNYSASNALLRTATQTYVTEQEISALPFPASAGSHILMYANVFADAALRPEKSRTVQQQGVAFSSLVKSYDQYARPVTTTKSSGIDRGLPRTEQVAYHDNLNRWVLGQVSQLTVDGTVVSQIGYSSYAQPLTFRSYGQLVETRTHDVTTAGQMGTVRTVQDGNGNVTTLSNWKRGVSQTIRYPATPESPSGATQSAVVNDHGWVTRVTDENGFQTHYQYDPMGRLSQISHPTGDSTAWNATTFTFARAAASAYGIPAGHWQRTEATGNGRKVTHLDALWRPLLVREYDTGNASGTQRFVRQTFDHEGRVTFASHPSTSGTPTTGTWTEYDALGRVTSVSQDSELGVLTTLTEYLSGFRTRTTNPRGYQTLTQYQAFDQPSYDFPVVIEQSEGRYTEIVRDVFGKPLSITRSGPEE